MCHGVQDVTQRLPLTARRRGVVEGAAAAAALDEGQCCRRTRRKADLERVREFGPLRRK